MASADILEDFLSCENSDLANIKTDFGIDTDQRVISIINDVKNTDVEPESNEYYVKVALKDESTYAYAPRRFAWSERI